MISEISGKVLKYGDSIDTDVMVTGKYLEVPVTETVELGKHAMEALDPEFPNKIKTSPVIIGGKNFGCGSSREQAPVALKAAGTKLILAESFGRIFFRNVINIGLPVMVVPGVSAKVKEGDVVKANLSTGEVKNVTTGATMTGEKLPDFMLELLSSGGLIAQREKELTSGKK